MNSWSALSIASPNIVCVRSVFKVYVHSDSGISGLGALVTSPRGRLRTRIVLSGETPLDLRTDGPQQARPGQVANGRAVCPRLLSPLLSRSVRVAPGSRGRQTLRSQPELLRVLGSPAAPASAGALPRDRSVGLQISFPVTGRVDQGGGLQKTRTLTPGRAGPAAVGFFDIGDPHSPSSSGTHVGKGGGVGGSLERIF